ncbi:RNA polymerase sporulation sigma factor SigK [Beduinella massiliensis]|uniref:RNA polymerase sporulation sigma factor SigK n=1 Tax=Beduinella massiliensis TaxID=1852363 RepID=UPI000C83DCF2
MLTSALLWLVKDALFFLAYVSGRSAFAKPLNAKEEAHCIARMQAGDAQAKNELVEHNMRLVAHIARKYTVPGYDADDLISIGTIGLIKGVSTFKSGTGTQLSTYCARCIENEILMVLRASQKRKGDVSLSEPIGTDGEGNEITLTDILGTDENAVPDEVDRRLSIGKVARLIRTQLPERERVVLELRYGLTDGVPHSQKEVARVLGISRSYVSRIEKRALETLCDSFKKPLPSEKSTIVQDKAARMR